MDWHNTRIRKEAVVGNGRSDNNETGFSSWQHNLFLTAPHGSPATTCGWRNYNGPNNVSNNGQHNINNNEYNMNETIMIEEGDHYNCTDVQSSRQHEPKHNGKKDEDDDDYICIDGIYVNANLNLCDDTINDAVSTEENDDRLFSTTITIEQSIKCRPKDLRVAWLDKFLLLEAYKEKHNDFIVPRKSTLGAWAVTQRLRYKKGILAKDRIDLLESIGFPWALRKRCPYI